MKLFEQFPTAYKNGLYVLVPSFPPLWVIKTDMHDGMIEISDFFPGERDSHCSHFNWYMFVLIDLCYDSLCYNARSAEDISFGNYSVEKVLNMTEDL